MKLPLKSNVREHIDLSLTPYLTDPISKIGKNKHEFIGVIAPTQSGKTVFLQVVVADSIDQDPGTLFYVMPDEKTAKRAFKEKVSDVVEVNSGFKNKLVGNERWSKNTNKIVFEDMTVYPAWASSLSQLSSIPGKRGILDEVRLMKLYIGDESNAIQLLEDRLTTYKAMGLAQMYLVSTPSIEGDLLHQQLDVYDTTNLYWHVPCPKCGKMQYLDFFVHMKYNDGKCLCKFCKAEFTDRNLKKDWNNKGKYYPYDYFNRDGSINSKYPNGSFKLGKRLFYRYNSLVSPFRSFSEIWSKYLRVRNKRQDYKNFVQAWLSQFWVDDISKSDKESLKNHIKEYRKGEVQPETKVITAGIDTQDAGFYVTVRAFYNARTSYLLDEFVIESNINLDKVQDVVKKFKAKLYNRIFSEEAGNKWRIGAVGIDTGGHRTQLVYELKEYFPDLFLVKGRNNQNTTLKYNRDLDLYLARTDDYLDETERLSSHPQSFSLPENISEDWLNQYTNIRKFKKYNRDTGEAKVLYKKIGQYDYRMADIHNFICLDVAYTEEDTLRFKLEEDGFRYNPAVVEVEEKAVKQQEEEEEYDDYEEFYELEKGDWWE